MFFSKIVPMALFVSFDCKENFEQKKSVLKIKLTTFKNQTETFWNSNFWQIVLKNMKNYTAPSLQAFIKVKDKF